MHIFLGGGGDEHQEKETLAAFKDAIKGKRHILYIPIAWRGDFTNLWGPRIITSVGCTSETCLSVKYRTYDDLKRFDAIFIGGGNTFALLKDLRDAKFIPLLKKFIASGRPVYGGSAGTIIFGEDIGTASFGGDADKNLPKMKDLKGIGLTTTYAIGCHYSKKDDKHYGRYSKKQAVITLSEWTGLHVEKDKITIIGSKPAYLFENGKRIELPVGSIGTYG